MPSIRPGSDDGVVLTLAPNPAPFRSKIPSWWDHQ